ncbi:MAG: hypothetical protein NZ576_05545, partial [Bacteroidia bacterium]|nr:hypothetical protein [Bacteroidia bacterium]
MFILHIPYFCFIFYPSEEALYYLLAERVCSSHPLYTQTWDYHPPLMTWIYSLFYYPFAQDSLVTLRIISAIWIYISAFLLNQLIINYKFLPDGSFLPAFLYISLASTPWYEFYFSPDLVCSFLIMIIILVLCKALIDDAKVWQNFFIIGLLLGTCFFLKYHALSYLIIVLAAYILITPPRIDEVTTLFLGFFVTLLAFLLIIYFSGSFSQFWDQAVVFNLDLLISINTREFKLKEPASFLHFFYLWGAIIAMAILGFFSYRTRFYKTIIRQRKFETIMGVWLILGTIALFFSGFELRMNYFLQVLPPYIFYSVYLLRNKIPPRYRM